jgi:spore germination protein GerM
MKRLTILVAACAVVIAACGAGGVGDAGNVTVTTAPGSGTGATTTTQAPGTSPTTVAPGTPSITQPPQPQATQFVDVYFVKDGRYATTIARAVPATPEVATEAIKALIEGPTSAEAEAGLSSAVPTDTLLLGITIRDGKATIDLSREFEAGGGSFGMTARLAQVVYTLTQFPTVDRVEFWLDGTPVTVFSSEGLLLEEPVSRSDYLTALPLTPTLLDAVDRWEQSDLPDPSEFAAADTRRVVLVADDDVLNVRIGPGTSNEIIGMLAPGVVIGLTGPQTEVGSSTWVEIVTPAGAGWVNDFFLASVVSDDAFANDPAVTALLDETSRIMAAHGDLSPIASERGLYVSHHAVPVRFTPEQLVGVLSDSTTYKWPSNALDVNNPDDAKEIPDRTFAAAIGDRFVSTYDDADRSETVDQPIEGGNGRIPEYAIPFELKGFHYIGVHDPGDNPDYGGLDWTTWYVSIDYENGHPVVVALTVDEWSP